MKRFFLIALTAVWLVGCPYYNTFYNARKAFQQAERIRNQTQSVNGPVPDQAKRLYEEAIENAALVIRDYPGSDLVDDALVLIGDAFLAQGEIPKAVRKYEEALVNYPDSEWQPYCLYAFGKSSLAAGDTLRAEETLQAFLQEHPRSEWSPDAHLILGSISFARQLHEQTIQRYSAFLNAYPKHKRRLEAQLYMGEAHMELTRYSEALELFSGVARSASTSDLEFQARYMAGECLRRDQRYEEALNTFETLFKQSSFQKHRPKLTLARAACLRALNRTDEAIALYEEIITKYESDRAYTEEIVQAFYEQGHVYEERRELKKAEEFYDKADKRSPPTFWVSARAREKSRDIRQLQKFLESLGDALSELLPDSSARIREAEAPKLNEKVAQARFQLAEHFLFRFDLVDSALAYYRQIEEDASNPDIAAKAVYARAWILENVIGDTSASRSQYNALFADYGKTVYAARAATALTRPDPNGLSETELFMRAERFLFTEEKPDSAEWYYGQVMRRYPSGAYASRALLALGWTQEACFSRPDSAIQIYRQVGALYPRTPVAEQADARIRVIETWLAESQTPAPDDSAQIEPPVPSAADTVMEAVLESRPKVAEEQKTAPLRAPKTRHGDVIRFKDGEVTVRLNRLVPVKPGDTGILFPTGQSPGQESAEPIATIEVLDVRTTRVVQTIIGDANTDFMDRPEGKIIGMLTPASVVEALSEQGMWTQIRYKNQTGFVRTEQILSQSIQEDRAICQITNMAQPIAPDADLGVSFDLEASPSP